MERNWVEVFPLRRDNRRSCAARAEGFKIPAQVISKYLPTFVEYPPMQAGASFSTGDLKEKVEQAMKASQAGQHWRQTSSAALPAIEGGQR